MNIQATAKLLIKHIKKPCLYMRELTNLTGLSNTNISMHEKRGNIKLEHTPPESRGRGAKILYPFIDLIEVISLSELVKMNQPTIVEHQQTAWLLSNIIFRQLEGLAEPDKEYIVASTDGTTMHKAIDSRYAVIYEFMEGTLGIHTNSKPEPPFKSEDGPTMAWWVIDCHEMALNIMRIFDVYQHVLER